MKDKDIPKTAFRFQHGHYEYSMISFGVYNVPGVLMDYMNMIFHI